MQHSTTRAAPQNFENVKSKFCEIEILRSPKDVVKSKFCGDAQHLRKIETNIKNIANKFGYLYDFDPDTYLKGGAEYHRTRKELIQLEKKLYIKILENDDEIEILQNPKGSKITIQIKKFAVCDDIIDEEESSWINETVIFEINIDSKNTSADEIENSFKNFTEIANSLNI